MNECYDNGPKKTRENEGYQDEDEHFQFRKTSISDMLSCAGLCQKVLMDHGPCGRPGRRSEGRLAALGRPGAGTMDDVAWRRLDRRILERHVLARGARYGRRALSDVGARVDRAAAAARELGHRVPRLPL